ncbi:MAG: hypothetical protein JW700_04170 [Candidatus Aenigmarchaeota archaeon]|nr:hypothetical protein [Candidatus Aenigmarchaeota archaeon]
MKTVKYLEDPKEVSDMLIKGGSLRSTDEYNSVFSQNGNYVVVRNECLSNLMPRKDERTIGNMTGLFAGTLNNSSTNSYDSPVSQKSSNYTGRTNKDLSTYAKYQELSHSKAEKTKKTNENPFSI